VLVDGHSRSIATRLSEAELANLLEGRTTLPQMRVATPELRPMRCPVCSADLPFDRSGEIRFCHSCGRAVELAGADTATVPYTIECDRQTVRRPLLLPVWRFSFGLSTSAGTATNLAAVRRQLGLPLLSTANQEWLDVPAFRPYDRRRVNPGAQSAVVVRPAYEPRITDGPLHPGSELGSPARFVSVRADEATAIARLALLLTLCERDAARLAPQRLRRELLEAPLELSAPRLVVRAVDPRDVGPPHVPDR
jgi:hypothetical protein